MAVSHSLECCRTLLEHGSSATLADMVWGWTPLHNACNEANYDIINLLLQHGGDMNKADHYRGWTPTDLLTQATDAVRLADGDDFDPGESESDGGEFQIEDTDIDAVLFDEGYDLSPDERRHIALRMALSMQESESDEDENQAEGIDMYAVDEGYDISPDERRHIALRRALIMQKVSLYFTREALSRVSRSMQQVDFDRLVEAERGKIFPQLLAQTGPKTSQGPSTDEQETKVPLQVRLNEQRNIPSCFIINDTGVCVERYYISPSASKSPRDR
jgi:Ankyrin repeats (3 copies)